MLVTYRKAKIYQRANTKFEYILEVKNIFKSKINVVNNKVG